MNKTYKSSQGFTLVEVIISIAILSVCSVVALQLFITAQNLNTLSRHTDIASVFATNNLEKIKHFSDTASMINHMPTFESVDQGFVQSIFLDENFKEITETSSGTLNNYLINTVLNSTNQIGLYDIQVTVTDVIDNKALVQYTTAHYFNEEVSYDELP